jgi:alpha-ketoglutarate-dependent taurine dioxygenase
MTRTVQIDHRPFEPFGAEVDLDLSRPLDAGAAAALRELFFERSLLVFHGQSLTMEDQARAVSYVGQVLAPSSGYLSPEDGILNTRRLDFHSDLCSTPLPFDAISLHAQDVDEGNASTKFASGLRAYGLLPQATRDLIAGLEVNMVQTVADKTLLSYDVPEGAFNLVRPVVLHHRITGEPIVYCSESSAARIEGWARAESDALLAELFATLYDPGNIYRHVWRNGDLVIWDNLSLQHGRDPIEPGKPRRMQRVVAGLKTLREQVPAYDLTPVITEMGAPAN